MLNLLAFGNVKEIKCPSFKGMTQFRLNKIGAEK